VSVISASRLARNTGDVFVFGLRREISSADSEYADSPERRSFMSCRKKAKNAFSAGDERPTIVRRQNLSRESMAGKIFLRFSKSYSEASDDVRTRSAKKCLV
jgi:hypothetical protein